MITLSCYHDNIFCFLRKTSQTDIFSELLIFILGQKSHKTKSSYATVDEGMFINKNYDLFIHIIEILYGLLYSIYLHQFAFIKFRYKVLLNYDVCFLFRQIDRNTWTLWMSTSTLKGQCHEMVVEVRPWSGRLGLN
jgi:hypothetical protein